MSYSYTTAELIQAELRATSSFSASTIPTLATVSTWIDEESNEINQLGGRVYGSTSYTEVLDYSGEELIQLKHAPVISVTSLLYSTSRLGTSTYALDQTAVEDTDFTLYGDRGELAILTENWRPTDGRKKMSVTYVAGYATIPSQVKKLATKKVAKRVLDSLLNKDLNNKESGKSVSVGSISIVKPSDFGVKQYSQLITDIESLQNDIIKGTSAYRISTFEY